MGIGADGTIEANSYMNSEVEDDSYMTEERGMSTIEEVYVGQPYTLKLDTNDELSGASDLKILYRKPNGDEGTLSGSMTDTVMSAKLPGADNDVAGLWNFQTSAVRSGDTAATLGDTVNVRCRSEWEK